MSPGCQFRPPMSPSASEPVFPGCRPVFPGRHPSLSDHRSKRAWSGSGPLDLYQLHAGEGVKAGVHAGEVARGELGLEGFDALRVRICLCEAALKGLRPGRTSSCSRW